MAKRIGSRTIELTEDVRVAASAAVAGKKEGEGPLKDCFDYVSQDSYFAEDSWEKAETSMLRQCFGICRGKAGGATLAWDAAREVSGDPAADAMLAPFARGKYDLKPALAAAGLDYRKMIKPLA